MRLSNTLILALPVVCLAEEQVPLIDKLRGWFNKATSYIPASIPTSLPDVRDAGAAKVAEVVVHPLNLSNWKSELSPRSHSSGPANQEWMVFVTGGNKTCGGLCGNITKAWNTSAALLAANPKSPKLASIDCDREAVLCTLWAVNVPSLYHFVIPRVSSASLAGETPKVTARYININRTSTTATDFVEVYSKKTYLRTDPYEGVFQPFNGILAVTGVGLPLAYIFWAVSLLPSWAPMILVSFLSRSFLGRRRQQAGGPAGAPAAAPAPAGAK